ncbi:hypothetical protein [Aureimonas sp. SA4125]|uniref:hypothetical protein n=1 Tax=Aureimonas sp. SA4125 TaxID=2826993 RepID=UPI001CC44AAC|nr:hypothetical protein [Aureimonas sp. SA4125]
MATAHFCRATCRCRSGASLTSADREPIARKDQSQHRRETTTRKGIHARINHGPSISGHVGTFQRPRLTFSPKRNKTRTSKQTGNDDMLYLVKDLASLAAVAMFITSFVLVLNSI